MSRTTSIALAAAIVMSVLAAMSYDMSGWRALDGSDSSIDDLRVGRDPSMHALMLRKHKPAWLDLAGKNFPAWAIMLDTTRALRDHEEGANCFTLDDANAACFYMVTAVVDQHKVTFAELTLWESKGEGHLGKGHGPLLRVFCENRHQLPDKTFDGAGECRDFDTDDPVNSYPRGWDS